MALSKRKRRRKKKCFPAELGKREKKKPRRGVLYKFQRGGKGKKLSLDHALGGGVAEKPARTEKD